VIAKFTCTARGNWLKSCSRWSQVSNRGPSLRALGDRADICSILDVVGVHIAQRFRKQPHDGLEWLCWYGFCSSVRMLA
jgi:hypothetical protein